MEKKKKYDLILSVLVVTSIIFISYIIADGFKSASQKKELQEKYDAVVKERNDFAEKLNFASREYILCYWAFACNKFPDVCRGEGITDYDIDVAERACSDPDTYVAIHRMFTDSEKRR